MPSGAASRQIAVMSSAPRSHQELDGRGQRAAGGEHRVEHVALPPGEVVGQPLGVRGGLERLLVAHHAEEPDLGRRQQPLHALEHPEAGPQDRHHERPRVRQPHARCLGDRRLHLDRFDAHLAGGLVGEQRHQLVGQTAERR